MHIFFGPPIPFCNRRSKIKTLYYMCLDIWRKPRGSWMMAQPQVPLPIMFLQIKNHIQTTFPYHGDQEQYLLLLQFPASPQNDSNKLITSSCRNKDFINHRSYTTASACLFCFQMESLCGPVWHTVFSSSRLWI